VLRSQLCQSGLQCSFQHVAHYLPKLMRR
jgi:hypothetical protein